LIKNFRKSEIGNFKQFRRLQLLLTFTLVNFAWIFFRANSISDAIHIVYQVFTNLDYPFIGSKSIMLYSLIGLTILFLKEVRDEFYPEKMLLFENNNVMVRYLSYASIVLLILLLGVFDGGQFIYFQF